jgi:predicted nucleic acid-binding protein
VTYLLDTNVVSELRKPQPDAGLQAWLDEVPSQLTFLSVLVLGELRQGIERLRPRDALQALALERWLYGVVDEFEDRVLAVDSIVAEAWGRLNAGAGLPVVDGLLAATALVHGLTVVTRDTDPFERAGVPFVDPWSA